MGYNFDDPGSTTGKTQAELVEGCDPVIEHEPLGDWYDEDDNDDWEDR
jgi:hypothetical protein